MLDRPLVAVAAVRWCVSERKTGYEGPQTYIAILVSRQRIVLSILSGRPVKLRRWQISTRSRYRIAGT